MSKKVKTLVILTPGFPKDESDTVCLPMLQSFVRSLNEKYRELKVIVLAFQYPYSKKTYYWNGNKVISFDGRNRGGLTKLFLALNWTTTLRKIHNTNNVIGLLSLWYAECALIGKRFANKHRVKHFCWMWGQDAKKGNKYVALVRLQPGELVAFSDFLQSEFEKNYEIRPGHVVPPGVDKKDFTNINHERNIDIIAAGSLIPLKQYDILIEIIAAIKKQIPLIKVVLIGDGPERTKLKQLIKSSGLESNITLTGELPHPAVLQNMQKAKVFLHTSNYEGFGIVCIEALCSGCRVISFVRPMVADIENWDFAASKEEMVEKSIGILSNSKLTYKSVVPYSIEDTVEKFSRLFSI